MHSVIHASRYKVRTVCSEAGKSGGLPRGREGSRGGNPGSVRWIVWLRRCLRRQSGSVMHMPATAGTQLMPISRR